MAEQQAGWYPDPSGDVSKLRYWDGFQWTNDFTDAMQAAQPVQQVQPVVHYAQPMPNPVYVQVPVQQTNGLAIAALICGILGIFSYGVLCIPAIITGAMGRKNPVNQGMATAGMVLGIIGAVGWIVFWIFMLLIFIVAIGATTYPY